MNPADHCLQQAVQAFNNGPHTSFKMLEVILRVLRLEPRDILRDPTRLYDFRGDLVHDNQLSTTYKDTWGSRTGRCTSFALRVARELRLLYPNDDFQFFNLGRHRVGRCRRYGIVVDAESNTGVQILPAVLGDATLPHRHNPNWRNTPNPERGRWIYYNNQLIIEPRPDAGTTPTLQRLRAISDAAALGICLEEVAKYAVLVCAFRQAELDVQNQAMEVYYYGSVRWRLAKRRIELIPNVEQQEFSTITFGEGTADTNRECGFNFTRFMKACGLEDQWSADDIDMFHRRLWGAAILEWGYPVWKAVERP